MKKIFFVLTVSFFLILIINLAWIGLNLYLITKDGIQSLLQGRNLLESIYYSVYLRWILLTDVLWMGLAFTFVLRNKHYKTDSLLHYLHYHPMESPSICVIIPTYNEELSIGKVVRDFFNQRFVKYVIVIDNNSSDNTVNIAANSGAKVIKKNTNMGYSHSLVMGLREALGTDANIIATTEADGTYNAYDIEKMTPYLDNCDMVIGTRQHQIITEKGNQNSIMHVLGNYFLAKLIQIKYFNLQHMGVVNLSDVGCVFRLIRRESLETLTQQLTHPNSDRAIGGVGIGLYFTMIGIENNLRIIEIPITFNKRIGLSKIESNKPLKAIKIGFTFLWIILAY